MLETYHPQHARVRVEKSLALPPEAYGPESSVTAPSGEELRAARVEELARIYKTALLNVVTAHRDCSTGAALRLAILVRDIDRSLSTGEWGP